MWFWPVGSKLYFWCLTENPKEIKKAREEARGREKGRGQINKRWKKRIFLLLSVQLLRLLFCYGSSSENTTISISLANLGLGHNFKSQVAFLLLTERLSKVKNLHTSNALSMSAFWVTILHYFQKLFSKQISVQRDSIGGRSRLIWSLSLHLVHWTPTGVIPGTEPRVGPEHCLEWPNPPPPK